MSLGDETVKTAVKELDQCSRTVEQLSVLLARILDNLTEKHKHLGDKKEEHTKEKEGPEKQIKEEKVILNKFAIGERYNEIGRRDPHSFIQWLFDQLSQSYNLRLKGILQEMLTNFERYDNSQFAAEKKLHMPWENSETMVEPDYYIKQKQTYCNAEMPNLFKVLGMQNEAYWNPEIIAKAHVLEEYIDRVYTEATARELENLDKEKVGRIEKEKNRSLRSIDLGKNISGFKVNINDSDVEIVIMTRKELKELAGTKDIEEPYQFLLLEEEITRNDIGYLVIDASNESFKNLVKAYEKDNMQTRSEKTKGKKEMVHSMGLGELNNDRGVSL